MQMFISMPGAGYPAIPINTVIVWSHSWGRLGLEPGPVFIIKAVRQGAARFIQLVGLKPHGSALWVKVAFPDQMGAIASIG